MVSTAVQAVSSIPICVKIRLLTTTEQTVELCQQLCRAGASLIAIHARQRASWERTSAGARDGPADLHQVAVIKQALRNDFPNVAVITNGNTITYQDVRDNLELTRADGLMSAEGILDNPALFLPRYGSRDERDKQVTVWSLEKDDTTSNSSTANVDNNVNDERQTKLRKLLKKLRKIEQIEQKDGNNLTAHEKKMLTSKPKRQRKLKKLQQAAESPSSATRRASMKQITVSLGSLYDTADDKLKLVAEYLDLATAFPVKMRSIIFHTRRMLKDELVRYQLLEDCLSCESIDQIRTSILQKIQRYRADPYSFVYDREKAKQEKEAMERKRREEGKRKAYEARMIRKAKREGKADLHHYLKIGAAIPTLEKLAHFKTLSSRDEVLALWKKDHSQHCLVFHLDDGGCKRGRTCAFLHVDIAAESSKNRNTFVEKDEVAG